jgi:hypothetical protein
MSANNKIQTRHPEPDPESEEDIFDEEEEDEDMDFVDPSLLLQSLLSTEDGSDTICTALVKIYKQMEVHNKIMVKMLSHLVSSKKVS